MFPGLVIWNETAHARKTWSTNRLHVRDSYAAVGELLVCKKEQNWQKEPNNTVGTYCENRRFIGY